jgi:hypothetical protein
MAIDISDALKRFILHAAHQGPNSPMVDGNVRFDEFRVYTRQNRWLSDDPAHIEFYWRSERVGTLTLPAEMTSGDVLKVTDVLGQFKLHFTED